MNRIILAIIFSATFLCVQAQKVESVFIQKAVVEWFENEVTDFNKTFSAVQSGKLERQELSKAISSMKKAVRLFDDNSVKIYNRLAYPFDYQATYRWRNAIEDGKPVNGKLVSRYEYRNIKKRESGKYVEFLLTEEDVNTFLNKAAEVKESRDVISSTDRFWSVASATTKNKTNLETLHSLNSAVQSNYDLLMSKRVN